MIIPDPFTNQLTSRFAGAISSTNKPHHHHHQNGNVVQRSKPTSTTSNTAAPREISTENKSTSSITSGASSSVNSASSIVVPVSQMTSRKPALPLMNVATTVPVAQTLSANDQTIELKTKPKATVKPNLTTPHHDAAQIPKLIKVNVVNSKFLSRFL